MIKFSDTEKSNERWQALKEVIGDDSYRAMREFYTMYDADLAEWLAGLYDPCIGGFYYSQSARDNKTTVYNEREYTLLPDLESTLQALGIVGASGMTEGRHYSEFIPEWMKTQIADFTYSLQDPDGFFYHPQWGKEIGQSRRGRDLSWARTILSTFERDMKYTSVADSAKVSEDKKPPIPEHLSSKERFIEYLDSLNIEECSYPAGNTLSAQSIQIKAQGLTDTLIEYLNAKQNPGTGLWHHTENYYGVNGLMKISGLYNSAGRPLPHAKEAAYSAIAAITAPDQIRAVVDLWNTWVAVGRISENLRKYPDSVALADEILRDVRLGAAEAIVISREKLYPFKKELSSFSYHRNQTSHLSQGMPVAVVGSIEGDVNATMIGSTHMISAILGAMGAASYAVPLLGKEEGDVFLDIINKSYENANKY